MYLYVVFIQESLLMEGLDAYPVDTHFRGMNFSHFFRTFF